jgi:membrane protein implicated in regulation of membrane protease activity
MQELPRFFKAWVLFALVATVGAFLAGAVAGFVLGTILGAAGSTITTVKWACGAAGFAAGLAVSFYTFKWAVSEFVLPQITASREPDEAKGRDSGEDPIFRDVNSP